MSDAGPRPTAGTGPLPSGPPNALVVDGILDGRVRDAQALREAVERLSTCGAGAFRLDITGGRFSLLPVETHVPPGAFDLTAQSDFLDRLHEVVQAAQDNSVEATLRCQLVYGAEVAETLFVVRGARVEPLTRRRPALSGDAPALPTTDADTWAGLQRRQLLLLAPPPPFGCSVPPIDRVDAPVLGGFPPPAPKANSSDLFSQKSLAKPKSTVTMP